MGDELMKALPKQKFSTPLAIYFISERDAGRDHGLGLGFRVRVRVSVKNGSVFGLEAVKRLVRPSCKYPASINTFYR